MFSRGMLPGKGQPSQKTWKPEDYPDLPENLADLSERVVELSEMVRDLKLRVSGMEMLQRRRGPRFGSGETRPDEKRKPGEGHHFP